MIDYGARATDKELAILEDRISRIYTKAYREMRETANAYTKQFDGRDAEMRKMLEAGEITEEKYIHWRMTQVARGAGYERLRDDLANRMYTANAQAVDMVNGCSPAVYAANRNWSAYEIESEGFNLAWNLWDESTVTRLLKEDPQLMPNYPKGKAIERGIDLEWSKKVITASVTKGIIMGSGLGDIATDMTKELTSMSRTSAIRAARTAMTGAQNAGRIDTYNNAIEMGINVKKEWMCTLDSRTRHSHQMLDGEKVAVNGKFSNGCRYPGDPDGRPGEVYNCRCTLIADIADSPYKDARRGYRDANDRTTDENGNPLTVADMTYKQWTKTKEGSYAVSTKSTSIASQKVLPDDDVMTGYRHISTAHTIEDDEAADNPHFNEGIMYQNNCGYCSMTYEMRRRGYDVTAKGKNGLYASEWESMFDGAEEIQVGSRSRKKAFKAEAESKILQCGVGARGSIFVRWDGDNGGHFYNWEIVEKDGSPVIQYVDGQKPGRNPETNFDKSMPSRTQILRWDKAKPKREWVEKAMEERVND